VLLLFARQYAQGPEPAQLPQALQPEPSSEINVHQSGRVEQAGTMHNSDIDPRALRRAFACFATGVTVVTTRSRAGAPIGLTMNSFTSVSLDPPLILFSLGKKSEQFEDFMSGSVFGVNVLSEEQVGLSGRFSTPGDKSFGDIPFETWQTGAPIIPEALSSFDTIVDQRVEAGDHVLFICRVVQTAVMSEAAPLLFHRSGYVRLDSSVDA
jgi:flavin reductase (DIM6/NTAB) family NADH-FMN oxidoreductase RutF